MKKLIALIAIAFTMSANAQSKTDTAAKKPEPNYFIVGKMQDFQLLFAAVTKPGDVTPNQISYLAEWLQRLQALPTDTKKTAKPK